MTKQYLLMVDDIGMAKLEKVLGCVQYLEVQGMNIGESSAFKIMVTPVLPPVPNAVMEPAPIVEPMDQPV